MIEAGKAGTEISLNPDSEAMAPASAQSTDVRLNPKLAVTGIDLLSGRTSATTNPQVLSETTRTSIWVPASAMTPELHPELQAEAVDAAKEIVAGEGKNVAEVVRGVIAKVIAKHPDIREASAVLEETVTQLIGQDQPELAVQVANFTIEQLAATNQPALAAGVRKLQEAALAWREKSPHAYKALGEASSHYQKAAEAAELNPAEATRLKELSKIYSAKQEEVYEEMSFFERLKAASKSMGIRSFFAFIFGFSTVSKAHESENPISITVPPSPSTAEPET
jgi:hypothetical protein